MVALTHFTTDGIAPAERLEQWGSLIWQVVGGLKTDVDCPGDFLGSARFGQIGDLHLCQLSTTAHRVERQSSMISRDDRDLVKVALQQTGQSVFSQGGAEVLLSAGEWALYDTSRPYAVSSGSDARQLIVLVPRKHLGLSSSDLGRCAARRMGQSGGIARMVPGYISSLFDESGDVGDRNHSELGELAAQLVRLALVETLKDAPLTHSRDTLRVQVKEFIKRQLADPNLSLDLVAAHFGCSKRYISKVFAGDDQTPGEFLWNARLDRCREALQDSRIAHRSVTDIAYAVGFNDSAHFSRAFKARFGLSPTEFRRDHQRPDTAVALHTPR